MNRLPSRVEHVLELPMGPLKGSWSSANRISDHYRLAAMKQVFRELQGVLLDFGCGAKPYEAALKTSGITKWIGVDLPVRTSGEGHLNRADIFFEEGRVPMPDHSIDVVLSTQVLEHVPDLELSMSEIARVLKNNGKAVITVPMTGHLHEEPHDYRRFTPYGMSQLANRHGLKLERTVALGGPITAVTTLLISQLNFLARIPAVGKLLHALGVGCLSTIAWVLERALFQAGYRKALLTIDYLFVLSKA